jgi:tetratricopeptide (TPR) repeat protein
VRHSLDANELNLRALTLNAALLRHAGRAKEALAVLEFATHKTDPLDVRLLAERWLAGDKLAGTQLRTTLHDHPNTGLETAAEFATAGLCQDGTALLTLMTEASNTNGNISPLAYYYLGWFAQQLGQTAKAAEYRRAATAIWPDYVFPFQWETIAVLRSAIIANPHDSRAAYYLGNLMFDWQPEEAVKLWEQAAALDPSSSLIHRNLAVAYAHQKPTNDIPRAVKELEQAVGCPAKYALHFAELDELYAEAGTQPAKRLALLERYHPVVSQRDDALSREIGLKVFAGKYDEAIELMTGRKFSVWEGGSLEVADHWVNAHLLRGQQALASRKFAAALADFQAANNVPDNLPNDRGSGGSTPQIAYWLGVAYDATGDAPAATKSLQSASESPLSGGRRGGGSRLSEQAYYQALAKRKLGQTTEAESALRKLVEAAETELASGTVDAPEPDRRRVSARARKANAHYVAGLAHLALSEPEKAKTEFESALKAAPDLLGAKAALATLP